MDEKQSVNLGMRPREIVAWIIVSVIGLCYMAAMLYIYPSLDGETPSQLSTGLALRSAFMTLGVSGMTAGLIIINFITPSDWLEKIGEDPKAASNLCSAIVLGLAIIACFV